MLISLVALILAAAAPTPEGLTKLRQADREVDARVTYVPDEPGKDYWKPAWKSGDCEDFALAKRRMLIARGWDPKDLRVLFLSSTIDPGLGHAVLYSFSHDAVLDNMDEDTKPNGHVPRLAGYLHDRSLVLVCVIRDVRTGPKFASERC